MLHVPHALMWTFVSTKKSKQAMINVTPSQESAQESDHIPLPSRNTEMSCHLRNRLVSAGHVGHGMPWQQWPPWKDITIFGVRQQRHLCFRIWLSDFALENFTPFYAETPKPNRKGLLYSKPSIFKAYVQFQGGISNFQFDISELFNLSGSLLSRVLPLNGSPWDSDFDGGLPVDVEIQVGLLVHLQNFRSKTIVKLNINLRTMI